MSENHEEKAAEHPGRFRFDIGQVVRHRRYGYRGVVYGRDMICRAKVEWYYANMSQPPRNQPWYHVLVHAHGHTTYVAETNLSKDESDEPVVHPIMEEIFERRVGDRYELKIRKRN